MANKNISQLTAASTVDPADLFVLEQSGVAKKLTGALLLSTIQAHGGIASTSYTAPVAPSLQGTMTITYADGTSTNIPIYNGATGATGATGANGFSPVASVEKVGHRATITVTDANGTTSAYVTDGNDGQDGEDGNPGYCWVKWASQEPTSDNDISDLPDEWMGIYTGTSSTAPTTYASYAWVKVKGEQGDRGIAGTGLDGNTFWVSNAPPYQQGDYNYFGTANLSGGRGGNPMRGDIIFYLAQYYFVVQPPLNSAVRVSSPYSMNGSTVPQGGTQNQVLGKLTNGDYDIGWISVAGSTPYDSNPAALGTASPGNSTAFARGNHVHPLPDGLIPTGGAQGYVLKKNSATDYDVVWAAESGGGGADNVYWATYGTTSVNELKTANTAGKAIFVKHTADDNDYILHLEEFTDDGYAYFHGRGGDEDCFAQVTGTTWDFYTTPILHVQNSGTPAALGTASRGSATDASRADHVHPLPLKYTTLTIATSDWSSQSCTKTVTGMTTTAIVWLEYSDTTTAFTCTQGANALTFGCDATPSASVTVKVAFMEGIAL